MTKSTKTKRPPIIAVVGHIDHGKSTLLDYIRKSDVVDSEAGGITQHIGAYEVIHKTPAGVEEKITFIDTPGHEAFSQMRVRGAEIADIVILVVSADDKVNVQTIESIKTIKDAKVPFIVAINKIDKPTANIENIKQELMANEVYLEGYGGSISTVSISAKTGEGVPELLDMILLMAEMEDLKKDDTGNGSGVIVESSINPKKGSVATLIIKNGTVHQGEYIIVDGITSPIRMIEDQSGKNISSAVASSPVRIMGLAVAPAVGSEFKTFEDKKEAVDMASEQDKKTKEIAQQQDESNFKVVLPVVIKTDFLGTLEAIEQEIKKLETEEVKIKIVSASVGAINANDIKLASSHDKPIVIGFNVKVDRSVKDLTEKMFLAEPKIFNIIYDIKPYLEEEIAKRMPIPESELPIGTAKVLRNFGGSKEKQIIGGKVLSGVIAVGKKVNISRHGKKIDQGTITSLQESRVKAEVIEEGKQFGSIINSKITIAPADTLEILQGVVEK